MCVVESQRHLAFLKSRVTPSTPDPALIPSTNTHKHTGYNGQNASIKKEAFNHTGTSTQGLFFRITKAFVSEKPALPYFNPLLAPKSETAR